MTPLRKQRGLSKTVFLDPSHPTPPLSLHFFGVGPPEPYLSRFPKHAPTHARMHAPKNVRRFVVCSRPFTLEGAPGATPGSITLGFTVVEEDSNADSAGGGGGRDTTDPRSVSGIFSTSDFSVDPPLPATRSSSTPSEPSPSGGGGRGRNAGGGRAQGFRGGPVAQRTSGESDGGGSGSGSGSDFSEEDDGGHNAGGETASGQGMKGSEHPCHAVVLHKREGCFELLYSRNVGCCFCVKCTCLPTDERSIKFLSVFCMTRGLRNDPNIGSFSKKFAR